MTRTLIILFFTAVSFSCQNNNDRYVQEIAAADSLLIHIDEIKNQMDANRMQYILNMHNQIAADSALFNRIERSQLKRYPVSMVYDKYNTILFTMDTALMSINKLQAEISLTERFINDLKTRLIDEELDKNEYYEKLADEENLAMHLEDRVNVLFLKVEDEITAYIKMGETLDALRNKYAPKKEEPVEQGGN